MVSSWTYVTRWGTFSIRPRYGRFAIFFENKQFSATYQSPEAALDDLISGTLKPSPEIDPSKRHLQSDLSKWTGLSK